VVKIIIYHYNSDNKNYDLRRFNALISFILEEMSANASTSIAQNLSPLNPKEVEPAPSHVQAVTGRADKPQSNRGERSGRGRGGQQGRGRSEWVYPNAAKAAPVAAAKIAGPRLYCWCHGWTAHAGSTCTIMTDAALGWTAEHRNAIAPVTIDGVMGHA
jgi:hypothetical protein